MRPEQRCSGKPVRPTDSSCCRRGASMRPEQRCSGKLGVTSANPNNARGFNEAGAAMLRKTRPPRAAAVTFLGRFNEAGAAMLRKTGPLLPKPFFPH